MRLFIIDTQVIIHLVTAALERRINQQNLTVAHQNTISLYTQAAISYVNNLGWIPYFQRLDDCVVVWVDDSKPYWRSKFFPDYKGKRTRKSYYQAIYDLVNYYFSESCDVSALRFQGYEADDIAAAIVRLWLDSSRQHLRQIHLCTVDSDWHGLVADSSIYWLNVRDFPPRVRGYAEIYTCLVSKWNQQSKRKQRLWALPSYHAFLPRQIWEWKAATGDRSDNLPEGTPLHMIDLMQPPRFYDLLESRSNRNKIFGAISKAHRPDLIAADQSLQALHYLGFSAPITTLAFPRQMDTLAA